MKLLGRIVNRIFLGSGMDKRAGYSGSKSDDCNGSPEYFSLLERMLVVHEGYELFPYKCTAGKLSIGVGRNLDDNGLSHDEVYFLLSADMKRVHVELSQFGWFWFEGMNYVRQSAIADMCFNLGLPRFLQFKNMIKALEVGDYETAAEEMLNSKWASQVGSRAIELSMMVRSSNELP